MIRSFLFFVLFAGCLCGGALTARADVVFKELYSRETAAKAKVGAVFGFVTNSGPVEDRLLSVSSPVCGKAEIHDMVMDGDIMQMRALEAVVIPAGGALELSTTGKHVMLMGLKEKLVAGQTIEVMFTFEHAGAKTVSVPVKSLSSQ